MSEQPELINRPPLYCREVTNLDEGVAALTLPASLSQQSYGDLKTWMNFILSKAARRAGVATDDH